MQFSKLHMFILDVPELYSTVLFHFIKKKHTSAYLQFDIIYFILFINPFAFLKFLLHTEIAIFFLVFFIIFIASYSTISIFSFIFSSHFYLDMFLFLYFSYLNVIKRYVELYLNSLPKWGFKFIFMFKFLKNHFFSADHLHAVALNSFDNSRWVNGQVATVVHVPLYWAKSSLQQT